MQPNTTIVDYDPLSPQFLRNPYPVLAQLIPHRVVAWQRPNGITSQVVLTYAGCKHVFDDPVNYNRKPYRNPEAGPPPMPPAALMPYLQMASRWMLATEGETHRQIRAAFVTGFTPRVIRTLDDEMAILAEEIVSPLTNAGTIDLVNKVAYPFPVTLIARMLGVPIEDNDKFREWVMPIVIAGDPNVATEAQRAASMQATLEVQAYLKSLLEARRHDPREDLISALVSSGLDEFTLIANLVLLLLAGHETTMNFIGQAVFALLQNPDQLALLRSDWDGLIENAIFELLRYCNPVLTMSRTAQSDGKIEGYEIPIGTDVILMMASANSDPEMFPEPRRLDILRENARKGLYFGYGPHFCIGAGLAVMEAKRILSALLRERNVQLADPNVTPDYHISSVMHSIVSLAVNVVSN